MALARESGEGTRSNFESSEAQMFHHDTILTGRSMDLGVECRLGPHMPLPGAQQEEDPGVLVATGAHCRRGVEHGRLAC